MDKDRLDEEIKLLARALKHLEEAGLMTAMAVQKSRVFAVVDAAKCVVQAWRD